jgi:nucleoid-associated protein YgaU
MQNDEDLDLTQPEENRNRKGVLWFFVLAALAVGGVSYYATRTITAPEVAKTAEPAPKPAAGAEAKVEVPAQPAQKSAEPTAASGSDVGSKQVTATDTAKVETAPAVEQKSTVRLPAEEPAQAEPVPQQETKATTAEVKQPEQTEQKVASAANPPAQPANPQAANLVPEPPSFDTIRVEPTGDALIAGRAAAGSEVIVKLNGKVIGKTKANDDGAFVLVPDQPLPAGAGSLSLETDVGGTIVTSTNTVAVAVKEQAKGEALVAVVKPEEPVAVIQAPTSGAGEKSNKVVLDAVEYDDSGDIVFSGRSNPGNAIRIYVDNALVGEVIANTDGKWTFNGKSSIAPGKHTLRADEVGKDGKVLSRVELPFLREEAAKVAAAEQPAASESSTTEPATEQQGIGAVANKGNAAVPQRIVIQPGNNLWRLSRLVYGRGTRYTVIYEANKDQIRNPDLIYPGQVFAMPVGP